MEQSRLLPPVWVKPGVLSLWNRCWRKPPRGLGVQGDCTMSLQHRVACPHLLACSSPLERIQVGVCLIHPLWYVTYSSRSLRLSVSLWGPLFLSASQWVMTGTLLCPYLQIEMIPGKSPSMFSSVAQSCLTLCDPMDCSTPGFPVLHQLPEPTQTHVHWVSDAIQPSCPLSSPSPPAFNLSQHQGLFQWVSSSH